METIFRTLSGIYDPDNNRGSSIALYLIFRVIPITYSFGYCIFLSCFIFSRDSLSFLESGWYFDLSGHALSIRYPSMGKFWIDDMFRSFFIMYIGICIFSSCCSKILNIFEDFLHFFSLELYRFEFISCLFSPFFFQKREPVSYSIGEF